MRGKRIEKRKITTIRRIMNYNKKVTNNNKKKKQTNDNKTE